MSVVGLLSRCKGGEYEDGGSTSFSHSFTVDNWRLIGQPVTDQSWTTPTLARGLWQHTWEITSPASVSGASVIPTNANPIVGPMAGVASLPIFTKWSGIDDPACAGGYCLSGGVYTAYREQEHSCVYNLDYTGDCCHVPTDCDLSQMIWDGAGYAQGSARTVTIHVTNDYGSPQATEADFIAEGMPNYTTFVWSGWLGDDPP